MFSDPLLKLTNNMLIQQLTCARSRQDTNLAIHTFSLLTTVASQECCPAHIGNYNVAQKSLGIFSHFRISSYSGVFFEPHCSQLITTALSNLHS